MAVYCPIGSNYYHWPPFSTGNLISVGPATTVDPEYLLVNSTQAATLSPGVEVIDIGTINRVGLVVIAKFYQARVYRSFALTNFARTIGFQLASDPADATFNYGFYYGQNIYSGGNVHIWTGGYNSGIGISPFNLTSGPINLTLKWEVTSRTWSPSIFNWYYTHTSTAIIEGGATYTQTATSLLGDTKIIIFDAGGSSWNANNYARLTDLTIYSPYLSSGTPCGGLIIADYTSDITTAAVGEIVTFSDLSGGANTVTGWNWDFGDSTFSSLQNPTHSWATEGYKTVALTATSIDGDNTKSVTDYATVYFDYNLTVTRVGLTNVVSITWDEAPGATSYTLERDTSPSFTSPISVVTSTPGHLDTFTVTGTYYYRVRSDLAVMWSTTADITISFVVDFVGAPLSGDSDLTVNFTDLTIGYPTTWDWDFGDGSPHSTVQNPSHVYTVAGVYTVTLSASNGPIAESIPKVDYITVAMVTDFTAGTTEGFQHLLVNFTDLTKGEPTAWDWDFGDGSPHSTEQNPIHYYAGPGDYTVTLTSSNSSDSDYKTKIAYIHVLNTIIADFVGSPTVGYVGTPIQFTDLSEGYVSSWEWYFGDGSLISNDQNPIHSYYSQGLYTVTMVVSDGIISSSVTKEFYIDISLEESGTGFVRDQGPTLIFD